MRRVLTADLGVGLAIIAGLGTVLAFDIYPETNTAEGAAYALVVAAAAYFGRRAVILAGIAGIVLAVAAPFFGAESEQPLFHLVSGRIFAVAVIALTTIALAHLLRTSREASEARQEVLTHQQALRKITRLALTADKPLKERLEIITEWTVSVLGVDRVGVGHVEEITGRFRFLDIWDKRLQRHMESSELPDCFPRDFTTLIENDLVTAAPDIHLSPKHCGSAPFFDRHSIVALLHVAAAYRSDVVASLIASSGARHDWNEREIVFAKSVAQIVALIFAMQDSERTLDRLDHVSQGVFVLSGAKTVYANKAARELAGVSAAGDLPELPFALSPFTAETDFHEVLLGARALDVYRTRLPDDEILVRIADVTDRNTALSEALRMEEQLKESAKLHAMGQMAAGVAHDFNNTLSAIMGFAQILSRKLAGAPEREFSDRILGVCKKGRGLIQEILGFARTASMERNPVDLRALLENDLDLIPGEESEPASLIVELPEDPLPVFGNAAQLLQLIQNLVVNAQHACEGIDGHITISAGRAGREGLGTLKNPGPHERILGGTQDGRPYCFLRVADNGHGIAADVMDRIFEPFFTTKGKRKGSGLGLVVVHGVVDSHNGCCHVRSEPGLGTVFTIYLPLHSEEAVAAE
jgi:Signal transduction histidine kinase